MKKTGCNMRLSDRHVVVIMCNDAMLKLTAEKWENRGHCARSQVPRLADGVRAEQPTLARFQKPFLLEHFRRA